MYHKIPEQELHPDDYELDDIDENFQEDECHDFLSKPRQTQTTIGLYLKKKEPDGLKGKVGEDEGEKKEVQEGDPDLPLPFDDSPDLKKRDPHLENLLQHNKGFWVDKPTVTAPMILKLQEHFYVDLPKKDRKKSQGIFYRPDYLELDHLIKLGEAGLLYPDEEISDTEDEIQPDNTMCLPLRKQRYKVCDPCKPKVEKQSKTGDEPGEEEYSRGKIKKIQTGCQCDYYGDHGVKPTVWDNPFRDEIDMIRQHEINKYLKPFKCELLNRNYEKNPPVAFKPRMQGAKRCFPHLMLSNL